MKQKRYPKINSRRLLNMVRTACLTGALVLYGAGAYAATISNGALPEGADWALGNGTITIDSSNVNTMNIVQNAPSVVIKWTGGFNIGANATVNFLGRDNNQTSFNVLNYDTSNAMSNIYGELNGAKGNIYVVNPAGVMIGKSAQIDVGSLYVSNKTLKDDLSSFNGNNFASLVDNNYTAAAQLMSLGNINADKVTFDGDRIVLDVDRLYDAAGNEPLNADNINIITNNADNVVLGYLAYDSDSGYAGKNSEKENLAKLTVTSDENNTTTTTLTKADGYMWVERIEQLQAINTNLSGNYALHNGIEAIVTQDWKDVENGNAVGFQPIGSKDDPFTGKFDGLDYSIYGLNINRGNITDTDGNITQHGTNNVGLFGVTSGASINNVTLISGSISGLNNVGAIVGSATNTTTISNSTSSAKVVGDSNVGGIAGSATDNTTLNGVINTGLISGYENVGGLLGYMEGGSIEGTSYNLGSVTGIDYIVSNEVDSPEKVYVERYDNTKGWSSDEYHEKIWIYNENGEIVEATYQDFLDDSENLKEITDIYGRTIKINTSDKDSVDNGYLEIEYQYSQISDSSIKARFETWVENALMAYTASHYSHNIGGLVGSATNEAVIGNKDGYQVFNQLNITGGYNVGGIVGNLQDAQVQNAANNGNVTATGYTSDQYKFHTDNKTQAYTEITDENGIATKSAYAGNVGGIVGSATNAIIRSALNTGDVMTVTAEETTDENTIYDYYISGNVGGIVGSATDTNISDVENKENSVFGAHNVGGIAGYFGSSAVTSSENSETAATTYTIADAINNESEIMATGARGSAGFVKEWIRPSGLYASTEEFIVGNMGGIAGYLYGDNVKINGSGNSGTVHASDIVNVITEINKVANVGGIVGKIDNSQTAGTELIAAIKEDEANATVSNSYNTGEVRGYTGVGGIAGLMYNGSIAASYNLGDLRSTFIFSELTTEKEQSFAAVNMGGIVGDTTEQSSAKAYLYNVYNKGTIGDADYDYGGRHVGGIVGRLSGSIDNAYNNGAIYNNSIATGGIVGWWYNGDISNVFNTGNITVFEKTYDTSGTIGNQVGGIAGGANGGTKSTLSYAYNLGTLRSVIANEMINKINNAVGGIIGQVKGYSGTVNNKSVDLAITNVYTVGNLYAGEEWTTNSDNSNNNYHSLTGYIGAIYGPRAENVTSLTNAYYIAPSDTNNFTDLTTSINDSNITTIKYENRFNPTAWEGLYTENEIGDTSASSDTSRMYYNSDYTSGTLPILNAFMASKDTQGYFDGLAKDANTTVQYGTAYNPLLIIVNTDKDYLNVEWDEAKLKKNESLAVHGAGLTITGFEDAVGQDYYSGLLYSDGDLSITSDTEEAIQLGNAAALYGSSVTINNADGDVTIHANITATGKEGASAISIKGANVEITGSLTSIDTTSIYTGGTIITINGIGANQPQIEREDIGNPYAILPDVAEQYVYEVKKENGSAAGDISITASGSAQLLLGNLSENIETGLVSTAGDLTVSGDSVYVDSDLSIGGDLTLEGKTSTILDISNIGQIQKLTDDDGNDVAEAEQNDRRLEKLHKFITHFAESNSAKLTITGSDSLIGIDMWDEDNNSFDLNQYDIAGAEDAEGAEGETFGDIIAKMQNSDKMRIWISDGEQLAAISQYAANNNDTSILTYNFALQNDIDMTAIENYIPIGFGKDKEKVGYSGTFDGLGHRIIGLDLTAEDYYSNVGLFSIIKEKGIVKNVNIYSSEINAKGNAGPVAGTNYGTISGVFTFGNTIYDNEKESTDDSYVGGIVGVNNGTITGGTLARNAVYSSSDTSSYIGGIAGSNSGTIEGTQSISGLSVAQGTVAAMGGIAGVNSGTITNTSSYGVISGINNTLDGLGSSGAYYTADNVGGIVGINTKNVKSAYNDSVVYGFKNIGGIAGVNEGEINDIANAATVRGGNNVGGIVGNNSGNISNGRNNGAIIGHKGIISSSTTASDEGTSESENKTSKGENIGGLVGISYKGAIMTNLTNDMSASITGFNNVGGIIGSNGGVLTDSLNLMNTGTISGVTNVGGIAGENSKSGAILKIANSNDYNIVVNHNYSGDYNYFGGIVGNNAGYVADVQNNANITVAEADYVGGIIGQNNGEIGQAGDSYGTYKIEGYAINNGTVKGTDYVGGVIGQNNAEISKTDLINTINADVSGTDYVGGVIGQNTAVVSGGRDEGNNYYAHQVYNNGTVSGTKYVGGLIGDNTKDGDLNAAYNTGAVSGTSYVGGIAGNNAGTIEQVFNSVSVWSEEDEEDKVFTDGTISGVTNVGGITGNNSGSISDAYNTSEITLSTDGGGSTNTDNTDGSITGVNSASGSITRVYSTTELQLAGTNSGTFANAYSLSDSEKDVDGIEVLKEEDALKLKSSFNDDFVTAGTSSDDESSESTWKFYDGLANPLLRVFLTKATFTANNDFKNLIYNAQEQGYVVKAEKTTSGDYQLSVYVKDNEAEGAVGTISISGGENAAHSLADYLNTMDEAGISKLLTGGALEVNAGDGYVMFASQQIDTANVSTDAASDPNPNNLGYDIEQYFKINKYTITTNDPENSTENADLNVILQDIYRTYGNVSDVYSDSDKKNKLEDAKKYAITSITLGTSMTDEMKEELTKAIAALLSGSENSGLSYQYTANSDGGILYVDNSSKTANVGSYTWKGSLTLTDDLAANYQFDDKGGTEKTFSAKSIVQQADLTLSLSDVSRVYGQQNLSDGYSYSIYNFSALVNGDTGSVSIKDTTSGITDNALNSDASSNAVTKDVGEYTWNVTENNISAIGFNLDNYSVKIENGKSFITPAELTLNLSDVKRIYGDASLLDGYSYAVASVDGLVNGDNTATAYENINGMFAVTKTSDGAVDGLSQGQTATNNAGNYTWTGTVALNDQEDAAAKSLNNNYTFKVVDGSSVVEKANMVINLNDITMIYGDSEEQHTSSYGATDSYKDYLVNGDGDTIKDISDIVKITGYENTGFYTTEDGTIKTHDVGDNYSLNAASSETVNGNYNVTIQSGNVTITPKELSVNDFAAAITYGQTDIDWKNALSTELSLSGKAYNDDDVSFSIGDVSVQENSDYSNNRGNRDTADVGSYDDSLAISGITLSGAQAKNYTIDTNPLGRIVVEKAKLTVNVGDVSTIYGTAFDSSSYSYTLSGTTNGDTVESVGALLKVSSSDYTNSAALDGSNGKVTQDAGSYEDAVSLNKLAELKNYNVTVENGDATVDKAELTVNVGNVSTIYGTAFDPNSYSYTLSGTTNGDTVESVGALLNVSSDNYTNSAALDGSNGKVTQDVGVYEDAVSLNKLAELKNYDVTVEKGDATVEKAKLTVNVDDVSTIYGTAFDPNSYSYTLSGTTNGDTEESVKDLLKVSSDNYTNSAALDGSNGKVTQDVGVYEDAVSLNKLAELKNYDVTVEKGDATVEKAELTISLNDVHHTYGTPNLDGYAIEMVSGLTNGDQGDGLSVTMTSDTALKDNNTRTNDVKGNPYDWQGNVSGIESLEKNYNIKIEDGKSYVDKAKLTITVNNTEIAPGETPEYSGSIDGLTNGDTEGSLDIGGYAYEDGDTPSNPGTYDDTIGIIIGNDVIVNEEQLSEILSNYEVDFTPGDLTVTDTSKPEDPNPPDDPDKPDTPERPVITPDNLWQAEDKYPWYQWDKQRNKRERKAEINFVKGGMKI